ncbi:Sugar kinase of the NBD/HSP70 family, may contain an N-terminal HTH domain [Nonomuraea solani]|uniref:Sugar kinase of the NBD/HSP70 family, may contain an N-terminal HTH domain n=1 Tax=Nonomuraea solani TaxID=1144553 RepID=A0A1H5SZ59_9ACTN|nr:ROK family transcriptional regulator [Nonomuraea solani]SEF55830.1 Sugar kinase of the NBD/HSP70 family, may contain an N-terminal HTH domain [Nonomuraea solani]
MTELRPGDASLLRKVNTQVTLRALRREGVATLTRLGRITGLSRQTVEAVLDELGERGYIREIPPDEGVMGRPARRYGFRADAGHVVGLEVGGDGVVVALADLNGDVVAWERAELGDDMAAHERIEAARDTVLKCVNGAGVAHKRIWAVAAGTPGIVDRTGRVTLSLTLPGWTGLDLAEVAGRWFGCRGLAANDANLAALAEHWRGSARHASDIVYVLIGHRAGAGILIGGRLHRGRSGAAGEIGTLRQVGWEAAARDLVKDASAAEVFEAASKGDHEARERVERYAEHLAVGASALILTVDPDLLVLGGGGYSQAGDVLLEPVRRHLAELCVSAPEAVASTLGDEGVALGAVRLALDHVEREVLGLQ